MPRATAALVEICSCRPTTANRRTPSTQGPDVETSLIQPVGPQRTRRQRVRILDSASRGDDQRCSGRPRKSLQGRHYPHLAKQSCVDVADPCFDFVAAATFVAEIGDARRFAHPRALMAYLGLVPSESSSGQTRHQGSITKTGNKHARRILIEAAWNYRHSARISRVLEVRQQGQSKIVRDISWRAQLRLTQRFRHLAVGRRLPRNKVNVAIARELAGFIWDIARQVGPLA
jgi:transposase